MEQTHYEKYGRKCYFKNKEKYRATRRRWADANKASRVKAVQAYKQRNLEKVSQYEAEFNRTAPGRYRLIKYRHQKRGWDGEVIPLSEFAILTATPCFYCGEHTKGGLDRVDNGRGYSADNVVSCCEICNHMKWKLTQADFIAHVERIANFKTQCL